MPNIQEVKVLCALNMRIKLDMECCVCPSSVPLSDSSKAVLTFIRPFPIISPTFEITADGSPATRMQYKQLK